MSTKAGPLKSAFETDTKGVVYQELITYKVINNMLTKEIVTRTFQTDGNYVDSVIHKPLAETVDNTKTVDDVLRSMKTTVDDTKAIDDAYYKQTYLRSRGKYKRIGPKTFKI
jgi:hypothetical protein